MHLRVILAAAILVGACNQSAFAQAHPNLDAKAIVAQQATIRAEALAGAGRYKDMPAAKREQLFALQDMVTKQLDGRTTTTELPEHDQIAVFNTLEAISAMVNQAEDERMICERKRPVGTNRSQTVCMTLAQRNAQREAGAEFIQRRDQR